MFIDLFSENGTVYEIMWKNVADSDRPHLTMLYGSFALHAGQLRLQTAFSICNIYCCPCPNNGYMNAPKYSDVLHCMYCLKFLYSAIQAIRLTSTLILAIVAGKPQFWLHISLRTSSVCDCTTYQRQRVTFCG